jgi:hypothetical protein
MTPELAAKAAKLSPDARRVLVVLSHGGDWRSLANIARVARMGEGRARRALLELGPLVASYSPHTAGDTDHRPEGSNQVENGGMRGDRDR